MTGTPLEQALADQMARDADKHRVRSRAGVVFDDDKAALPTAGMSWDAHLAPSRPLEYISRVVREAGVDAARERFPAAYRAARRAALEIYRAGGEFDPFLIPERCR